MHFGRPFLGLAAICSSTATAECATRECRYQPRPYEIDVPENLIQKIRDKAAHYEHTVDLSALAWFDGPPTTNISHVAQYIATKYDWFEYQSFINTKFSHYFITIPAPSTSYPHDVDLHFIHERSQREDAIPLILFHGWPDTSLEWEKVIKPLANPQNASHPAFHVIAPDLPGFGFSPATVAAGLGRSGHAAVFASLMQQLGYGSYAIYSTDLGVAVALQMIEDYEDRVLHHMTDFYWLLPNSTDSLRYEQNQTTDEESLYIDAVNAYLNMHSAYSALHSTLPLSIAHALNDSPIGFLAWVWQLDFTGRDLSFPYSLKELVSQVLTLFIPGVYGNIRSYKELNPVHLAGTRKSRIPTSVTQWGYPKPSYVDMANFNYVPRDWVERTANVTFYRRHSSGGHFPAYTRPERWLEDVREALAHCK